MKQKLEEITRKECPYMSSCKQSLKVGKSTYNEWCEGEYTKCNVYDMIIENTGR